ncbi:MAG: hypothetical protein M3O55_04090, partial [Actinomycetota bacterium]|nr:hypothetical protein [Actinomycetota bacterium]
MLPRPTALAMVVLVLLGALDGVGRVPDARANGAAPTVTVTNPVRITGLAMAPDGKLTTRVTTAAASTSAEAFTGATVGVTPGFRYKLTTCLTYHRTRATPLTTCADRLVDTRGKRATIHTSAPTVRITAQPRPTGAGSWAYFAGYTQVTYAPAGLAEGAAYTLVAHSWPDNGLQGAAIAVPGPGQGKGRLPANDPVVPEGAYTGAINTGRPDSICRAATTTSAGRLPPGLSTRHPAFAGAPAYYEVGGPTGAFAGRPPVGVMLVIHGGGWYAEGSGATRSVRPMADRWRARGWETVNLTYHACGQSLGDVLWFYDKTRAWFGSSAIVCATGASAGGHLALTLAAKRKGVYCVVSEGGPTDLDYIQQQTAFNPATGATDQTNGGRVLHNLAAAAFGGDNLASVSPVALARGSLGGTRVLQGFAEADPLVPYQQALDLRRSLLESNPGAYVDT